MVEKETEDREDEAAFMNYEESMERKNQEVMERYQLALDRIREIAIGESTNMNPAYQTYFRRSAIYMMKCHSYSKRMTDGSLYTETYENLSLYFRDLYEESLPEHYVCSYLNPDYAMEELGRECGALLCYLYKELYMNSRHIFDQKLPMTTIYYELFLEIYGMYCSGEVHAKQLKDVIYWFLYDYTEEFADDYVTEALSTGIHDLKELVMEEDLTDPRSLFRHGVPIDETSLALCHRDASMSREELAAYVRPYVDDYMQEASEKIGDSGNRNRVILSYPPGYDRPAHAMIAEFEKRGMEVILYPVTLEERYEWDHSRQTMPTLCGNPQYDLDHREDLALFLDKRLLDRKNDCLRKCIKRREADSAKISGFLRFLLTEKTDQLARKKSAVHFTEKQRKLIKEYDIMSRGCIWDVAASVGIEKKTGALVRKTWEIPV